MRTVLAAAGAAFLALSMPVLAEEPTLASAADPARLALAEQTVDYVFPAGTYARMMGETMDKMMDVILNSTMGMPLKDFTSVTGGETSEVGKGSLAEMMEIYDPAYKVRMGLSTRTMMTEMGALMTRFEPDIRSGLASAYAKRFDAAQLDELNRFFATPTGKAYAADSYIIMMSPDVMEKMQALMPQVMRSMPAIIEKVKIATEKLPKARTYADLSDAEKSKLATILGMSQKELDEKEAAKADGSAAEDDAVSEEMEQE
jgi:hypothetical protein